MPPVPRRRAGFPIVEIYEVIGEVRSLDQSQVKDLATGEVFTTSRGMDLGLVDQMGDFNDALGLAVQLCKFRPRPLWVLPRHTMGQRLMGRMAGEPGISGLAEQFRRLPTGASTI